MDRGRGRIGLNGSRHLRVGEVATIQGRGERAELARISHWLC